MSADLQQACDVLAKWRLDSSHGGTINTGHPLVDGTAGNPELLDAIDTLIYRVQRWYGGDDAPFADDLVGYIEDIATAIIAADERMTG